MKTIRIELKLTAIVHVGEDIVEGQPAPARDPDAVEVCRLTRCAPLGPMVNAGHALDGHLTSMIANSISPMGERLRHELRLKNL